MNVTKAERIKAVERVCKRLWLGEEDKHTWEWREDRSHHQWTGCHGGSKNSEPEGWRE